MHKLVRAIIGPLTLFRERLGQVGRRPKAALCAAAAAVACAFGSAGAQAEIQVPPGFQADAPIGGVSNPTTLAFAPDGRVFVAERRGRILVFDGVQDETPEVFADFSIKVHAYGDRGLLGLALDPDFPAKPYVYVAYTHDAEIGGTAPWHGGAGNEDDCPDPHPNWDDTCVASGRVSRFTLDAATGVAKTTPEGQPAEQVLVEDWCQQFGSHSIGDLEFEPGSRRLYASGGEGANFQTADIGQLEGNPCNDPVNEGGALRSQDARTPASAGDPTGYNGSILRIDPDTGAALPDNPWITSSDQSARRITAFGLRNPFRMEFRPGTSDLFVQDTGWDRFEEIDRLPDQSQVRNFGWPCYEGSARQPEYDLLDVGLCESLYSGLGGSVTPPFYQYGNSLPLFDGDDCSPDAGSASSGISFYAGSDYPAAFSGAVFIANAARGCIWSVGAGPGGLPDPATVANFATPTEEFEFTPVDVVEGPDGSLYVPDFYGSRIVRFRHFDGNQPPVAALSADKTYGAAPLTTVFDAGSSADADGDPLLYEWDLDGDGQFDDASGPDPSVQHTYTNGGANVLAKVRVSDSEASDLAGIQLYPGDLPPVPSITQPTAALRWAAGDRIDFSGSASDPDEGALPAADLDWTVLLHHCREACHVHPLTERHGVAAGNFTGPSHDYGSYVTLELTATDARGLAAKAPPLRLDPRVVNVQLLSKPAGVELSIDDEAHPAPFITPLVAGVSSTVVAPLQAGIGGQPYHFTRWSDGGARAHSIKLLNSATLTAFYAAASGPAPEKKRIHFGTRPSGLPIRVGNRLRHGPFTRMLAMGSRIRLAAPRRVSHDGEVLVFKRWSRGGARVRNIVVRGPAAYVAYYRQASLHRGRTPGR